MKAVIAHVSAERGTPWNLDEKMIATLGLDLVCGRIIQHHGLLKQFGDDDVG